MHSCLFLVLTFLCKGSCSKCTNRGCYGRFPETANEVAEAFYGGYFRVYHTDDIVGAELGGAQKYYRNFACGIADGMGTGLNTRAALMTRGLAEITRLAVATGANPLTLAGWLVWVT